MSLEWMDVRAQASGGAWVSCNDDDPNLFALAKTVLVGNWEKALFWESAWLQGMQLKDIAPNFLKIASKRKCTVRVALENGFGLAKSIPNKALRWSILFNSPSYGR
jgi:hypothetical protein